jgi:hypothetical protein
MRGAKQLTDVSAQAKSEGLHIQGLKGGLRWKHVSTLWSTVVEVFMAVCKGLGNTLMALYYLHPVSFCIIDAKRLTGVSAQTKQSEDLHQSI